MVQASKALTAALSLALTTAVNGYWLMGANFITTERLDPLVNPGAVSGHVHSVVGGSNFGFEVTTESLVRSQCTSVPIKEDKSNYWFPHLYFQWANGSFTSVNGGSVIYYLFPDQAGRTTAFPPNFRMLSGNPRKRSYDANSHAARAVDFLCLDFNGQTTRHQGLPNKVCPSGIRSQVNFPSCWNGRDLDSPNHKSHVAYRSNGPDSGECTDPNFPVSLPRIFLEVYWGTADFDRFRSQAMRPEQPFVFAYGDRTGYGNHADFTNGWEPGVLQRAVDGCNCNQYGDPECCAQRGIFTLERNKPECKITRQVDEITTGTLAVLPGNNPVQEGPEDGVMMTSNVIPARLSPAYVYHGNQPDRIGSVIVPATTIGGGVNPPSPTPVPSSSAPPSPSPAPSSEAGPGPSPNPVPTSGGESPTPGNPVPSSSASSSSYAEPSPSLDIPLPTSDVYSAPTGSPTAEPSYGESSQVVAPTEPANPGPGPEPSSSAVNEQPTVEPSPEPVPSASSSPVNPPASHIGGPVITLTPAPGPTGAPVKEPTKTYISTRKIKPTAGACKPKHKPNFVKEKKLKEGKKNHQHHRRSFNLKNRHSNDYYQLH
ncbi:hypothetical protein FA15DRAFT_701627 [Coprinopsis marcescibilis]|uniref:DUF1996 domain-containing protein n=1 Tax=Coprinopsis marcescibilis TaxID=230819 RepID=A0A5C3LH30_COPMA|nr:hypothetical protein FA15DRAFT_701627 [Coprinopsis marcescibilis]